MKIAVLCGFVALSVLEFQFSTNTNSVNRENPVVSLHE
ncbi:hypothetical protein GALL_446440 [mine drainage metagenome]|uniref:Uncharacterized protein n=1 Tax=mine drainage metagenome TaxID=410659 RepID=A0A1J5Q1H0_9ZZZZ